MPSVSLEDLLRLINAMLPQRGDGNCDRVWNGPDDSGPDNEEAGLPRFTLRH